MCGEITSQFQVEPAGSPPLNAHYAWRYFCGQLSRNSALGSCEQMWSKGAGYGEAQTLRHGVLSLEIRARQSSNWRWKWYEGPLDSEQGGPLELLPFTAEGLPLNVAPETICW